MGSKRKPHRTKKPKRLLNKNAQQGKKALELSVDSNSVVGTNEEHQGNGKPGRGGDSGRLLTDPKRVKEDTQLIERAVRSRWGIRRKGMIQRRLLGIVEKTTVSVATENGPVRVELPADSNAIAASRVLVAMNAQDQSDDHKQIDKGNQIPQPGVQLNVNIESGQSRILQLAQSLGAREIIIDGKPVRTSEGIGQSKEAGTVQQGASESVVSDSTLAKARAILETEL